MADEKNLGEQAVAHLHALALEGQKQKAAGARKAAVVMRDSASAMDRFADAIEAGDTAKIEAIGNEIGTIMSKLDMLTAADAENEQKHAIAFGES